MDESRKKYVKISDEVRKKMVAEFQESVKTEFRKDRIKDDLYKYEVVLQDIYFVTYMTDEEVKLSAQFTIDLLEELKEINNSGIDKKKFEQLIETEEENNEVMRTIKIWNIISTDRMHKLLAEIDRARRVGGAWALLIANPGLINAIWSIYEQIVDKFDDMELYEISGFFLLRAIMKMHSDEIKVTNCNLEDGK